MLDSTLRTIFQDTGLHDDSIRLLLLSSGLSKKIDDALLVEYFNYLIMNFICGVNVFLLMKRFLIILVFLRKKHFSDEISIIFEDYNTDNTTISYLRKDNIYNKMLTDLLLIVPVSIRDDVNGAVAKINF